MLISLLRSGNLDFFSVIMYILSTLFTIFFVLPLHEYAHGFVAYKLGDSTAKRQGRLTLNPIAHVDYLGAALLLIAGFGWAKPVPINPRNFKNPKTGMALTALAGPVSNLLASIAAGLISNLIFLIAYKAGGAEAALSGVITYIMLFFQYLIMINIGLAVFNFLPVPPLDGSKILMAFLPDKAVYWILQREQIISIVLMVLVFTGGLNGILTFFTERLYNLISWLTLLPFSFFF